MSEYSYNDIIMDPNDPRLEEAIGKECYVSDFPKIALNNARDNLITDRLKRIEKEEACPFVDEEEEDNWAVIILKKEEPKPKFIPFSNKIEFIVNFNSYAKRDDLTPYKYVLLNYGMWLKDKEIDVFFMVTEIWDDGVIITDSKMKTTKEGNDEYLTINELTTWEELLRDYCFIDGTPCGKLAEENK